MFPAIFKIVGSVRDLFKKVPAVSGVGGVYFLGKQAGVILAFRAQQGCFQNDRWIL
jgi:hypothetical protein